MLSQINKLKNKANKAKKSNFNICKYYIKSALEEQCLTPHKSPSPTNASMANKLRKEP